MLGAGRRAGAAAAAADDVRLGILRRQPELVAALAHRERADGAVQDHVAPIAPGTVNDHVLLPVDSITGDSLPNRAPCARAYVNALKNN